MDEEIRNEDKDKEEELVITEVEIDKKKEKGEQEIATKKKKAFFLGQSKDSTDDSSEWGSFRIRSINSTEILDNESFYRTPLTNIIENETGYFFLVELPGLNKKHVNITLQEGILEILGEKTFKNKEEKEEKKKKEKKEDKDKKDEKKDKHKEKKDKKKEKYKDVKGDFLRREFRSPSFYRSFQLPEEISSEGIDASFKNGVLRLRVPKKLTDKRTIEIK
ncbi:MAG: Hsp20/alpha crystallin family protein [Candidatus Lokiarchaeota archaeon]|nr:Hsp20/alpha crystallin family protein [Candidatus Lokiarchaeota archaeon]